MWGPASRTKEMDMVATTGDYLRLWNVKDRGDEALKASSDGFKVDVSLEKMLNPVRAPWLFVCFCLFVWLVGCCTAHAKPA